jgi:hypothetical protein
MVEIILFLGTATANEDNPHGYSAGEKHAVLLFLRQDKGSAPNWSKAKTSLGEKGWSDIVLSEASPIAPGALSSFHSDALASYKDALKDGFAALVFSEAV